jgi:class 3 adenylate cyclase
MKCPRCQHDNREGRRFCSECGASLAVACPACGFSNEPGEKFCGGCGAPLGAPAVTATGTRFSSPDSYTPKHLAEKILTSKAALEGERKQVTVLFADLKGSMELLADRDPEEARTILDPVLTLMMDAVHHYEGTVNQVMGDGIMALFGAPLAHEDHAVRACYAALRMQENVKRYAADVRRTTGVPVQIRVGLNSGEVVVRSIGSDLHMDYTAVGQTTHLGARMEQMAQPETILLAPGTLALAEGFVHVHSLGPLAVKGLEAPLEVFELTGASAVRTRVHAAASRLSRFVGRDAEIAQLHSALELARRGRGQVTAVVGEPGVGKSRLAFELMHSRRIDGWLVLEARAMSYARATSYLPVVELLKSYFRIDERDTRRDIREKITGRVLALDRALEPALPALLALLDGGEPDAQWQDLDPSLRGQRTIDAVKGLLLREAQVQPLLLLFEDLHWLDSETQTILDGLVEALPSAPILLLVNYRPEYQHRWGGRTSYTQIRLDPLSPAGARALLEALLGADPTIEPLKGLLIERTEGNPFFLEESVRTLADSKALGGERGVYRLDETVTDIQIAPTVQAVLAARIDRLAPEDKRLLQAAAVIGREVPYALLAGIVDGGEDSLREGLGHLLAAEFIYETSLFPDLVYAFKHALTHEVAYSGLLHSRRKTLHAATMDVMESLYRDRLEEHVPQLAQHALRADNWSKAVLLLAPGGGTRPGSVCCTQGC